MESMEPKEDKQVAMVGDLVQRPQEPGIQARPP